MMKKAMKLYALIVMGASATVSCGSTGVTDDALTATVTVSTETPGKTYDPMIFGGFIEHFNRQVYGGVFEPGSPLADKEGFRTDVIEALKELKIPVVRWPGGCFVDGYHWQDGVGPDRKPTDDTIWGAVDPNTFGTYEFVRLCELLGAEAYICHNGLTTPEEMIQWTEYCNGETGKFAELRKRHGHPEPFHVKYWSVGNERGGNSYIDRVYEGTIGMKEVDPDIEVTCSGTHGGLSDYFFEKAADQMDLVSLHSYWVPNWEEFHTPSYLDLILDSDQPEHDLSGMISILEKNGYKGKIKIAYDEWNIRSWHHPGFPRFNGEVVDYKDPEIIALIDARNKNLDNSLYTMADALFAASFFNACLNHAEDIEMANVAPMVNQTGPLYVDADGIVKRPHFHTMAMYANLLEKEIVPVTTVSDSLSNGKKALPAVEALASKSHDGKNWVISLTNKDPEHSAICTLDFGRQFPDGKYHGVILEGDGPDAYNDVDRPERVKPVGQKFKVKDGKILLPPHSLIFLSIKNI